MMNSKIHDEMMNFQNEPNDEMMKWWTFRMRNDEMMNFQNDEMMNFPTFQNVEMMKSESWNDELGNKTVIAK